MDRLKLAYITLFATACLMSCDDGFLDRYPLDTVTHETYWKTEEQLKAAIYPCYGDIFLDNDYLVMYPNAFGVDAVWGDMSSNLVKIPGGRYTYMDGFPFTSFWRYLYAGIFTCNNFLDHYSAAEIPQNVKDAYAAEIKTLRALAYFWLTCYWGDVPWIDHVITAEDAYCSRTPRSEVVQHLLDDLDWAADRLDDAIPTGGNVGRINRWGALALKARIALQNEMWELAAATAKEIIDNSPYELYSDYRKLFTIEANCEVDPGNKESIIVDMFITDVRMNNMSNLICMPVDYVRWNPAKQLVDAYLCSDGKPAKTGLEYYGRTDVQTSGLYTFPEQHYADYFASRDPRMAMTLYVPGDEWPGGDDGDTDTDVSNPEFRLPRFPTLQGNNRNGANGRTGFYFKKYSTPALAGQTNRDYNDRIIIRYAEVLLIYAEALFNTQNETLTQAQIDATVNRLRDRVGMHRMILTELAAWGMNLKTELRRERRVELAFESMRYFDLLRWKEGEKYLGRAVVGPSHTVCINDLGNVPYELGTDEFGDIVWVKSTAEGGADHFDPQKHYLWPVPYEERIKNPLLGQNPGWEE
ncbi:MAG: RagB/SusD family nutrient uptake outer membrane protein [Bacteroidales bacterium]|nr:RagB/SusD family nutrient uptake outer membrane protein [Bacteroidales bacterium]